MKILLLFILLAPETLNEFEDSGRIVGLAD